MSTAGCNTATKDTKVAPDQGIGTRGIPEDAIGKDVADRFEQAKEEHDQQKGGGRSHILDDGKHKSGFEPVVDRARNLTAVTKEKMEPGGDDTRRPEVGFPARPNVH